MAFTSIGFCCTLNYNTVKYHYKKLHFTLKTYQLKQKLLELNVWCLVQNVSKMFQIILS